MENSVKTALLIGASGFAINRYENSKMGTKPYLSQQETNLKLGGGAVAFLGFSSAVILQATRKRPIARKIAFASLGVVSVSYILTILYVLRKMS